MILHVKAIYNLQNCKNTKEKKTKKKQKKTLTRDIVTTACDVDRPLNSSTLSVM